MDLTHFIPNDIAMGDNTYREELVTADLTGTAATITDTTTYAVADQDGLTSIITVTDGSGEAWDGVAQPVTFASATTTAAGVAAQMNAQLEGCSVEVSGGQVLITTDRTGQDCALVAAAGTGGLTWDTPVAGTGQTATMAKGTLLGRNSSTLKLGAYSDTGSNDLDNPRFVLADELVFSASGDLKAVVFTGGKVNQDNIVKHDDATAIGVAVLDELRINGIEPVKTTDHSVYDNS